MPAETRGSAEILRKAIAGNFRYISRLTGRNEANVRNWTNPQPSKEHPTDTGESNPPDIVIALCHGVEDPRPILEFINRQFGYGIHRLDDVQGSLLPPDEQAVEAFKRLLDLNAARKPNLDALRNARDELADATHRLVEAAEKGKHA